HDHVVDRHDAMARVPRLRRRLGVGDHAFQRGIVGQVRAIDRGVELALAQHFEEILIRARALDAGRLVVFGDMPVFERDPAHLAKVDAVVVLEDAAHPHRSRLAVGANTDAFAGELGRREWARRVAQDGAVLKPPHHGRRQEDERLAVGLGLHIGRNRHLADVELELTHHRLEEPVRRPDVGKGERDARRFDLSALERQRVRVIVEGRAQRGDVSVDAHELIPLRSYGDGAPFILEHFAGPTRAPCGRSRTERANPRGWAIMAPRGQSTARSALRSRRHAVTATTGAIAMTLILSNDDVEKLLTMRECIAVMEEAYVELADGRGVSRTRSDCFTPTARADALYSLKSMDGVAPKLGIGAVRINSDIVTWPKRGNAMRREK